MRGMLIGLGLSLVVVLAISACISDEPATLPQPDGGASSTSGNVNCGAQTTKPGDCAFTEDYCFKGEDPTAAPGCFPNGNGPPDRCASNGVLRCLAGGRRCDTDRPCCYAGKVGPGTTCARTLSIADTACDYYEPSNAALTAKYNGRPCLNAESGGFKVPILCLDDAECQKYDAGTCLSASMGAPVNAIFGVCSDYE